MAPSSDEGALAAMYLQTVKYFDVVAAVFDYCLTFNLEVSLMWPSRWSLTKILYALSRYSAFFDVGLVLYYATPAVSLAHCAQLNTGIASGNVFGIAVAEAIFVLRTYALSGRQPKVLKIFGTIYSACLIATVVMISMFLRNMIYSPPPLGIHGCNLTGGPFILVGLSFILVLLNETALMSYTVRLMIKTYRHHHSPLVEALFHDGVTYYVLLCCASVAVPFTDSNGFLVSVGSAANVVILVVAPAELRDALNTPLRVLHSVLSTRTLLHVREAERKMDAASRTVITRGDRSSTVHFADEVLVTWN
ncbi:hypothetical protein B0H12DRAFT_1239165 [Mycena haematopus]|nr:hypothetical protein B0H12DRAFT_1239165 [Mycena haematopus]